MLTIGQMARCYGLTTKTLRHYDSIGLFSPALTGAENGYRYYQPTQIEMLGHIVRLRQLGLPLERIRQLATQGQLAETAPLREALATHAGQLQASISEQQQLLAQLHSYLLELAEAPGIGSQIPELVYRPAFRVIGMVCHDSESIPQMWDRFIQREHEIGGLLRPGGSYGLCQPLDDGRWRYIAGLEVDTGAAVPAGMTALEVPAQAYARVEHRGPVGGLPATNRMAYAAWLPAAGFKALEGIEFEYMDERFLGPQHPDTIVELFIPVQG